MTSSEISIAAKEHDDCYSRAQERKASAGFTGATRNHVLLKRLLHRRLLELLSRAFAEIRE
jgi:hypothetical protein